MKVIGSFVVEEDNMSDGNNDEDEERTNIGRDIEDVADGKIKDNVDVVAEVTTIPTSKKDIGSNIDVATEQYGESPILEPPLEPPSVEPPPTKPEY